MQPLFEGHEISLGGEVYIVPAVSARYLKKYLPKLQDLKTLGNEEAMLLMYELIVVAFKRNYPAMEEDAILDLIDNRNVARIFGVVMNAAGLEQTQEGKA